MLDTVIDITPLDFQDVGEIKTHLKGMLEYRSRAHSQLRYLITTTRQRIMILAHGAEGELDANLEVYLGLVIAVTKEV